MQKRYTAEFSELGPTVSNGTGEANEWLAQRPLGPMRFKTCDIGRGRADLIPSATTVRK